jgi:RNA polymerase sigma-70 factor (sigma-E family)
MTALLVTATPRRRRMPARPAPDGFDAFVHETADRLYRSALLLCGDHHLAEDLTQVTYLKVYTHWAKVSQADSPMAYTRTVLTRTFLSHRSLKRSSERPSEVVPEVPIGCADPSARLDLFAALSQLSPRDRAVVVLRYWEDLSVARTAELLGMSESSCRSRAARALVKLRRLMPELATGDSAEEAS